MILDGLIWIKNHIDPTLTFLDLNTGLVERELARTRQARRSGPAAENMLRDIGAVASRIG